MTLDDSAAEADFADRNVGTNKTVTATGFALDGADAGNYSLGSLDTDDRRTSRRSPSTGGFTADNKVYDGNDRRDAS